MNSSIQHDTFHALFEDIADTAGILSGALVLTHNGSRVFASATPHSLKIWTEAQMGKFDPEFESAPLLVVDASHLDASNLVTYEYLREHQIGRAHV